MELKEYQQIQAISALLHLLSAYLDVLGRGEKLAEYISKSATLQMLKPDAKEVTDSINHFLENL